MGGRQKAPKLPPAEARPVASPRRLTNQRATVALQGTFAVDMPMAATTP